MDFAKMLDDAELPETTVAICLKGSLAAQHAALDRELTDRLERRGRTNSLAGDGTAQLREQIEALEAEMKEHTYPFRLRALGRNKWRRLMEKYPPRKEGEGVTAEVAGMDVMSGVNRELFMEPMLKACIIDPKLSDEQWEQLSEKLTDRQYEDLVSAAWDINQGKIDIPFSRAASLARRSTEDE
jgi:hypothetical protein